MGNNQYTAPTRQIKAGLYEALRTELAKPVNKKSSMTYMERFVKDMLAQAMDNPNSDAAKLLSRTIFTEDILDKLDQEAERLILRDKEFIQWRVIKGLYDKQREVAYDTFDNRKCIVCSRRAGKTELAARLLVLYCIEPNTPVLYIHNKIDNALSQCWPIVLKTCGECELQITKADKSAAKIEFANGSSIKMFANHDKSSAAMLRGGRYKLIIIDESQDMRNANELIDDVCMPMLLDYKRSCIILQGTPPRVPNTYFEKAYKSGKWKTYHWTAADNPFIEDFDAYVDQVCASKQIDKSNSLIQREYYGQFMYDTEAQVFANAHMYTEEPDIGQVTDIVVGMDFGFQDYNSTIGLAVNKYTKKAYVYFEWKENKLGVSEICAAAKSCYDLGVDILRKQGVDPDGHIHMFGDTSDQSILYEMRKKYGLPTYNAYKVDKIQAIAKLAEQLRVGAYMIPKGGILADEFLHIMYTRDDEDNVTAEIDDDIYHPEAAMALLYASRYIEELFFHDPEILECPIPTTAIDKVAQVQTGELPDYAIAKMRHQKNNRGVISF